MLKGGKRRPIRPSISDCTTLVRFVPTSWQT
jgi:hypothetical protein